MKKLIIALHLLLVISRIGSIEGAHTYIELPAYMQRVDNLVKRGELAALIQQAQSAENAADSNRYAIRQTFLIRAGQSLGKITLNRLFSYMNQLDDAYAYWQQQELHTIQHMVARGPYKWLYGPSRAQEIAQNKMALTTLKSRYAQWVSRVDGWLKDIHAQEAGEQQLAAARVCITQIAQMVGYAANTRTIDWDHMLADMAGVLAQLKQYDTEFKITMGDAQKPSHVARNWAWYTAGAVATAGVTAYLYSNGLLPVIAQKIKDVKQFQVSEFFKQMYNNYLDKPLSEAKSIFWSKNESEQHLQEKQQVIDGMIQNFMVGQGYAPGQIKAAIEDGTIEKYLIESIDKLMADSGTFVSGTAWHSSKIVQGLIICALMGKQTLMKVLQVSNLTITLASTLPVVVMAYAGYQITKGVSQGIYSFIKPRMHDYEPLRVHVGQLERMLNNHQHTPATELSHQDRGLQLHVIHGIEQEVAHIPTKHQPTFNADLQELKSSTYSLVQKLNVVQRMYRTYPFLMPAA